MCGLILTNGKDNLGGREGRELLFFLVFSPFKDQNENPPRKIIRTSGTRHFWVEFNNNLHFAPIFHETNFFPFFCHLRFSTFFFLNPFDPWIGLWPSLRPKGMHTPQNALRKQISIRIYKYAILRTNKCVLNAVQRLT